MKRLTSKQQRGLCQVLWEELTSVHPQDAIEVFMVVADRLVTEFPTAEDSEVSARELMIKWLERNREGEMTCSGSA